MVRWSLRSWQDGAVLFDEASGSCHALSSSAEVLCRLCLQRKVFDASSLADELFGCDVEAGDVQVIEQVLMGFASMNFIKPAGALG